MKKRDWSAEGIVSLVFGDIQDRERALAIEPGFHNVFGVEAAFEKLPLEMDFIDPASPFHRLKNLSTRIYRRFLEPHLKSISNEATVLDAGCGIGRFTLLLAERFKKVVAFDPSLSSLETCQRHLKEKMPGNVELHWADISFLDNWPENFFDVVVAMELICYTADPLKSLKRLVRVAKPDATILLSVEGRPGALCMQELSEPSILLEALSGKPLVIEQDRFVLYFDRAGFGKLLYDANLVDVAVEGSHYFGEGPFWQSIDDSRLDDPEYVEMIIRAEDFCRADPDVAAWARVFSAAGKKR